MSEVTILWLVELLPFVMLGLLALLLFTGLPVAFILFGLGTLFCLIGIMLGEMPVAALLLLPSKLISSIRGSLFYPAVAMLLFMGVALEKTGIATDMLRCVHLITRRLPAGMIIAVLIIGVLLAPAAGIVGASVVTISLISLPAMLRAGYSAPVATGSIAAAGTVGIILPPAVMLFFLAYQFKVPLGSMFMSTVVPGGMLIIFYAIWYMITARPELDGDIDQGPTTAGGWAWLILRGLVMPVGLIMLVLGSIMAGWATPSQSGAIGAAGALVLVFINGKFTWPVLRNLAETTANLSAMVFLIIMAAAVFSYPFRYFGGDMAIADALRALSFGPWGMFLLIVGIIFVLGFFIDWIEIAIITLPLMYPVLAELDFSGHIDSGKTTLLWMATVTALVMQTSFLTPPFGFALFFLKGSAPPGVTLVDIYKGIIPIVLIQLFVIGLVLVFPNLITWLPEQIYGVINS